MTEITYEFVEKLANTKDDKEQFKMIEYLTHYELQMVIARLVGTIQAQEEFIELLGGK